MFITGTIVADDRPNLWLHPRTGSSNAVFDLGSRSCRLHNGNATVDLGALKGVPSTHR